ncbi:MAG: nuclear transport factor 2 family protein [Pseudomonadota bacterium]|nr:nuclear transport factor 2 family protein [Pseudomonadota bacterium]
MIESAFARRFTGEWVRAWNQHDIDAVLTQCSEDIELIVPHGASAGTPLRGKRRVGAHWARVLTPPSLTVSSGLSVEPITIAVGVDSVTLIYEDRGRQGAQTFHFDRDGLVTQAVMFRRARSVPGLGDA